MAFPGDEVENPIPHNDPHPENTITNDLLIRLYQHGGRLTQTPSGEVYLLPGHAPDDLIAEIEARGAAFRFRLRHEGIGIRRSPNCSTAQPARYLTVQGCQAREACRQIGPCSQALMRRDCLHHAEEALSIPQDQQPAKGAPLHIYGVGPKRSKNELKTMADAKNARENPGDPPWEKRGGKLWKKYPWEWAQKVKKQAKYMTRWPVPSFHLPDSTIPPRKPAIRLKDNEDV